MMFTARTDGPLSSRFQLQLLAALLAGMTIGWVAGSLLGAPPSIDVRPPTGLTPLGATAADVQTRSLARAMADASAASAQYRMAFTQPDAGRDAMNASREYRALYTGEE